MPIIMAGKVFTATDLKTHAGLTAGMIQDYLQTAYELKAQLETWPDPDLITLGLSQDEINAIKGFYVGDLPAIYQLFSQSTWVKQLLGLGI
jgi:hypothetical protein